MNAHEPRNVCDRMRALGKKTAIGTMRGVPRAALVALTRAERCPDQASPSVVREMAARYMKYSGSEVIGRGVASLTNLS